jgi:hypothetical protein
MRLVVISDTHGLHNRIESLASIAIPANGSSQKRSLQCARAHSPEDRAVSS